MIRVATYTVMLVLLVAGAPFATALEIGDSAPDFEAVGVDGEKYTLESFDKAELLVVCFTCNGCPVAQAYEERIGKFVEKHKEQGVALIALNCNNLTESLEDIKEYAAQQGFEFAYAFDETGDAARAYEASVTPEFFVIQAGKIAYHGPYDSEMSGPSEPYLVNAVNALLAGETPDVAEAEPFGCGIKLK